MSAAQPARVLRVAMLSVRGGRCRKCRCDSWVVIWKRDTLVAQTGTGSKVETTVDPWIGDGVLIGVE